MADVNPRQVVLVTCRGKAELLGKTSVRDNIITLAWHSPLSFEPRMYGVCIGKTRFSCRLVKESKVFAVNFISYDLKDKALYCGRNSGASVDKFDGSGLTKDECETIDCCRIDEAESYMECEVVDEIDTGDHIFFVGKVLKEGGSGDRKRLFHLGANGFTSTL